VEKIGIARTWAAVEKADVALLLVDAAHGLGPGEATILQRLPEVARLTIHNKIDLTAESPRVVGDEVWLSAKRGAGWTCCVTSCSRRPAGRRWARAPSWRARGIWMPWIAAHVTWPSRVSRPPSSNCLPKSCGWRRQHCRKLPENSRQTICWVKFSASSALESDNGMLTWRSIADELKSHRASLVQANLIAVLAVAAAVPVPLLLPLMVDEVLLHHPGRMVGAIGAWFPAACTGRRCSSARRCC